MTNQIPKDDPRIRGGDVPEPVEAILRVVHPYTPPARDAILAMATAAVPFIPDSYEPWPSVRVLPEEIGGNGSKAQIPAPNVNSGENVAGHVAFPADNKEGE